MAVQVTPAFWLSLVTTAVTFAVAPTSSDVGGTGVRATEIAAGVELPEFDPEFEPEFDPEFDPEFEFEPELLFDPEFEFEPELPWLPFPPPQPATHNSRTARLARRVG